MPSPAVVVTTTVAPSGTTTLIQRLAPGLETSKAVDTVRLVFANPGADPRSTALVAGFIVLVVLFIALVVLMIAIPSRKQSVKIRTYVGDDAIRAREIAEARAEAGKGGSVADEVDADASPEKRVDYRRWITGPLPAVILLLTAFVVGYGMTSTQEYCARTCHAVSVPSTTAQKADHADCRQCHEGPLVRGVFGNTVSRSEMVYVAAAKGIQGTYRRPVDSAACLRCHADIATKETRSANGLVMSHAEPIAAGYPCTSCHDKTGHTKAKSTATMSDCLPCHDGKIAAARCEGCHTRNPVVVKAGGGAAAQTAAGRTFPAVRAAKRECTGCHDMPKKCDPCHGGIRMPHTTEYGRGGGHALDAAFEGKLRCWRCHDPVECGECHQGFDPNGVTGGHGPNWKTEHKASPWSGGCGCHSQRNPARGNKPMCILCHAEHYE